MPDDSANPDSPVDAFAAAAQLAKRLDEQQCDYALGGALSLGQWTESPRGTLDVDVTLFLPPDQPSECLWTLQQVGCEFVAGKARRGLVEHGFCQVDFLGWRVDAVLRTQGAAPDRAWVETQLIEIFGQRDPRINSWREIVADVFG